jgi:serine/threonine-protein kinase RsbW
MVIEEIVKSDLKLIPHISKTVFGALQNLGVDKDTLFNVRLAFEEALTNAIRHGNRNDSAKEVSVKVEATADKIEIEIKDQGQGFDFHNTPLPTEKQNLEKLSGRGVFLIRSLMDEVKYFDGGSRIKMVKSYNLIPKVRSGR